MTVAESVRVGVRVDPPRSHTLIHFLRLTNPTFLFFLRFFSSNPNRSTGLLRSASWLWTTNPTTVAVISLSLSTLSPPFRFRVRVSLFLFFFFFFFNLPQLLYFNFFRIETPTDKITEVPEPQRLTASIRPTICVSVWFSSMSSY